MNRPLMNLTVTMPKDLADALAAAPAQPTHHPETGEPCGTDAQEATAWKLKAENLERELEELDDINAQLEHWKVQLEEERAKLDRENVALNNALYDIYYEVKQGALPNPDDPWWSEAKAALAGTAQAQHRPIIRFRHGCEFCGKLNGCKHVSTQPDTHMRELATYRLTVENKEREIAALREALDAASSGLKWYRDTYADADSGADDEMQEEIDAALAGTAPASAEALDAAVDAARKQGANHE